MNITAHNIKEKMLDFTRLFSIERNIFQRFVIVYKYIRFLNKDPLTKEILQKIFSDTTKLIGENSDELMDEDKFLDVKGEAIFSREFWVYYTNLEVIYGKMKKIKKCHIQDKTEFEKLLGLFSKPYSKQMLELSFKIVNSEVFDRLDKECFFNNNEHENETYFDEPKSILYIKGQKIIISKHDKITNAHKILKHIFITNKDNITDDFFYAEIATDEFGEMNYTDDEQGWEKYRVACRDLKKKIIEQTDGKIKDFLIFNTGKQGRIKINQKYL